MGPTTVSPLVPGPRCRADLNLPRTPQQGGVRSDDRCGQPRHDRSRRCARAVLPARTSRHRRARMRRYPRLRRKSASVASAPSSGLQDSFLLHRFCPVWRTGSRARCLLGPPTARELAAWRDPWQPPARTFTRNTTCRPSGHNAAERIVYTGTRRGFSTHSLGRSRPRGSRQPR